jgi:hypothetical protein
MMFKLTRKLATRFATPKSDVLTFAIPSFVSDTPEARTKLRRDFRELVRRLDGYLEPGEVKQIVHEETVGQKGNTPKQERNARILSEWKEAAHKNKSKFAREYCERHSEEGHDRKAHRTVRQQLNRLLDIEEQQAKEKTEWEGEFQEAVRYRGKSLLGNTK